MTKSITAIEIDDTTIAAGDISPIRMAFDETVTVPKFAKALRGQVVLVFGSFDEDPRPNFVIPEVRRYTQLVDDAYPFFAYFLPAAPEFTQMYSWFLSLIPPRSPIPPDATGININVLMLITLVVARICAIREFCDKIFDNPSDIEAGILAAMPAEVAEAAAAALASVPAGKSRSKKTSRRAKWR